MWYIKIKNTKNESKNINELKNIIELKRIKNLFWKYHLNFDESKIIYKININDLNIIKLKNDNIIYYFVNNNLIQNRI